MKHFLLIFPHLRNKNDFGGQRSRHVLESMTRKGCRASVIVPLKDSMTGGRNKKKTWKLFVTDDRIYPNTSVYYANATDNNRKVLLSRMLYILTTSFSVLVASLKVRKVDAVVSVSLPFTFMLIGHLVSVIRRVPHFVEVRDIGIEVAAEIGVIRRGLIYRLVRYMEDYLYKRADRIIVVSNGFRQRLIERGVDEARIRIVELGYDGYEDDSNVSTAEWPIPEDKFVVLYSGTLGHVFNIDLLLDTARLLRNQTDILFVMLGGGQNLEKFRKRAEMDGSCVKFLGNRSKSEVTYYCRNADVCVYPARDGVNVNSMLGNKVFDYLGAGTAVIYAGEGGDVSSLIQASGGGISCQGSANELARNIEVLFHDRSKLVAMSEKASRFIDSGYRSSDLADKYTALVYEWAEK